MKFRKVWIVLYSCLLVCFSASCAGQGDWMSQPLPGDFVVIRSNNDQVQLCIPDEDFTGGTPLVGPVITEISYSKEYLLLKVKEPINEIESFRDLKRIFEKKYYIVVVESKQVLGPFSKEDFEKMLAENQITEVMWQSIYDLPKMEERS